MPQQSMTQEPTIRAIYNAANAHDVQKFLSFFAEDGEFNDKATEQIYRGKSEIKGMVEGWLKAFPDLKLQVSNIVGNGDDYCVELAVIGTHNGPMNGPAGEIPATGKKVNAPSCDVIRLKNGRIQSFNCYFEASVMMKQIGAMPSTLQSGRSPDQFESRAH